MPGQQQNSEALAGGWRGLNKSTKGMDSMHTVPAPDRFVLLQRRTDGVGADEVIGRFADKDAAYAELLRQMNSCPDLYGGISPVRRLITKDTAS